MRDLRRERRVQKAQVRDRAGRRRSGRLNPGPPVLGCAGGRRGDDLRLPPEPRPGGERGDGQDALPCRRPRPPAPRRERARRRAPRAGRPGARARDHVLAQSGGRDSRAHRRGAREARGGRPDREVPRRPRLRARPRRPAPLVRRRDRATREGGSGEGGSGPDRHVARGRVVAPAHVCARDRALADLRARRRGGHPGAGGRRDRAGDRVDRRSAGEPAREIGRGGRRRRAARGADRRRPRAARRGRARRRVARGARDRRRRDRIADARRCRSRSRARALPPLRRAGREPPARLGVGRQVCEKRGSICTRARRRGARPGPRGVHRGSREREGRGGGARVGGVPGRASPGEDARRARAAAPRVLEAPRGVRGDGELRARPARRVRARDRARGGSLFVAQLRRPPPRRARPAPGEAGHRGRDRSVPRRGVDRRAPGHLAPPARSRSSSFGSATPARAHRACSPASATFEAKGSSWSATASSRSTPSAAPTSASSPSSASVSRGHPRAARSGSRRGAPGSRRSRARTSSRSATTVAASPSSSSFANELSAQRFRPGEPPELYEIVYVPQTEDLLPPPERAHGAGRSAIERRGSGSRSRRDSAASSPSDEASVIAARVRAMVDGAAGAAAIRVRGEPIRWRDVAVLAETNRMLDHVAYAMACAGVPYVVAGSGFYGAREVRDLAAMLALLIESGGGVGDPRGPARPVGRSARRDAHRADRSARAGSPGSDRPGTGERGGARSTPTTARRSIA